MLLAGWYFLTKEIEREGTFPACADFSALVPDAATSDSIMVSKMEEQLLSKEIDTTAQRILFFGDSMVEGLKGPMADYAEANGHELTSVVWYSSNTHLWADTDTLQHFIDEVKPTYILVCLGSNQLFVRDLPVVEKNIASIVGKMGETPFVWISPPNWKDDTGINDLIIKQVGADRYFDSRSLTLARRSDHAHPTVAAAVQWCDTICSWLSTLQPRHPVCMQKPEGKGKRNSRVVLLQPVQ